MSIYQNRIHPVGAPYAIYEFVLYPDNNGYFYYSLRNDNGAGNTPAEGSSFWGGIKTYNNIIKPHFIWTPSYEVRVNHDFKMNEIRFGDGYTQRIPEGANNNLLMIDLTFDLRTEAEATAIAHFLTQRKGTESFVFTPSKPYNIDKLFVCKAFSNTFAFLNNYSINTQFEEVVF